MIALAESDTTLGPPVSLWSTMGFITRAIGRRLVRSADKWSSTPERLAAIQQGREVTDFIRVVETIAGSHLDDEAACARVRELLPEDREVLASAVRVLETSRTSFLSDRGYRLLVSAVDGTPVRPIDPAVFDQFSAEGKLGRLSLSDAFAYLLSLEPRIADELAQQDESGGGDKPHRFRKRSDWRLYGPSGESQHVVLNTDLAEDVVREYVTVTEGGQLPDTDPTPYFEREKRTSAITFVLGKPRPQAQN